MARQEVVSYTLTCDVCGDEIPEGDADGASHKLSWEGSEYQVDLCSAHQGELTEALGGLKIFVDAGRLASGGRRRRAGAQAASSRPARGRPAAASPSAGGRSRHSALTAVRTWALENGHKVGDRGRIPATVMAAYQAAHGSGSSPAPKRRAR